MASEVVKELNQSSFDQETKTGLVMMDFWAPWCGPCRTFAPIFEQVASKKKDKCKFFKINVDDEQELAAKFSVSSIPTLILLKEGKVVETRVGSQYPAELEELIDRLS